MSDRTLNPGELDLNLMWALDALLRERHVSRAADTIGLGQPAMSAALKRLRIIFRDELLVRHSNRYYLTPLASDLEEPVREVLKEIGRVFAHRPTFDPVSSDRTFVISAGEYINDVLVSRVLEEVFNNAPGITIDIKRLNPPSSLDLFKEGQFDLLIVPPQELEEPWLSETPSHRVFSDRWVCAIDRENPLVGDRLTMEQFRSLPQVGYGTAGRPRVTQKVLKWSEPRVVEVWTHSFLSIAALVKGTRMFSIIPAMMGRLLAETGLVRVVDPPFDAPLLEYSMYWHPMYETDPGNIWLRNLVREAGARIQGQTIRLQLAPALDMTS